MNRRLFLSALTKLAGASTTSYFLPPICGWSSPIIFNPADPAGILGREPRPYSYSIVNYDYENKCVATNILIAHFYPTGLGWRRVCAKTGEETYHPYVYRGELWDDIRPAF